MAVDGRDRDAVWHCDMGRDGDAGGVRGEDVEGRIAKAELVRNRDAVPGFLPWIMAVADPGESWLRARRRNPKRLGEMSQAAFLAKAQSLGFGLALPWGDSEKYDFVVWARPEGELLRVQVKATGRFNRGGYDVQPVYSTRGEGKKTYTARDIDVLAARVVIESEGRDIWYLLPIAAFSGVKSLRFFPDLKSRNPQWEGYREAWEWLGLEKDCGKRSGRFGAAGEQQVPPGPRR